MKFLSTMFFAWFGIVMPLSLCGQTLQYNLTLASVTFGDYQGSDPNFFPVKKDDGSGLYVAAGQSHWNKNQPNLNIPIAYQSGKKPRMTAKLELRCPKPITGRVKILCKMTNTNNPSEIITTFESKSVTPTGSAGNYTLLYEKGTGSELAKRIRYFSGCTLNWEISFDDGSGSRQIVHASRSTNELYVTWKKPMLESNNQIEHLHTLFHISCKANNNVETSQESTIFGNIWKLFDASNQSIAPNLNLMRRDGTPLIYYKTFYSWATSSFNLIKTGEGICFAFTSLAIDLCTIQGAYENNYNLRLNIFPDNYSMQACSNQNPVLESNDKQFLIPHWKFETNKCTVDCPKFPFVNAFPDGINSQLISNNSYAFLYSEVKKTSNGGIYGQNSLTPLALFWTHSLMKMNGKFYDASYGVVYNSIEEVQRKLAGWGYIRRSVTEAFLRRDINNNGIINPNEKYNILFTSNDNQVSTFRF
jgi:hypothetical protein